MDNNLLRYLDNLKIKYEVFRHKPVFTVEESKSIKASIPGIHTKNLFLKDEKSRFYLVCLPAEKRLNMNNLKKVISAKKLYFASSDNLKSELNLLPGSVSIFGMIYARNTHLILDKEIFEGESSGFHPNINSATLVLTKKNLKVFYDSINAKKEILKLE